MVQRDKKEKARTRLGCSHLSSGQSYEVVDRFGNSFAENANDNSSDIFISNSHVKINLQRRKDQLLLLAMLNQCMIKQNKYAKCTFPVVFPL